MRKLKPTALFFAASLLAAPTSLLAAPGMGEEDQSNEATSSVQADNKRAQQQNRKDANRQGVHHGEKQGKRYGAYNYHAKMSKMWQDPERFEKYLTERLETLETDELKSQLVTTYKARLDAAEQQIVLRKLMAEHKAEQIEQKELKEATLEKIAAEHKLKQLRFKMLGDHLKAAEKAAK